MLLSNNNGNIYRFLRFQVAGCSAASLINGYENADMSMIQTRQESL